MCSRHLLVDSAARILPGPHLNHVALPDRLYERKNTRSGHCLASRTSCFRWQRMWRSRHLLALIRESGIAAVQIAIASDQDQNLRRARLRWAAVLGPFCIVEQCTDGLVQNPICVLFFAVVVRPYLRFLHSEIQVQECFMVAIFRRGGRCSFPRHPAHQKGIIRVVGWRMAFCLHAVDAAVDTCLLKDRHQFLHINAELIFFRCDSLKDSTSVGFQISDSIWAGEARLTTLLQSTNTCRTAGKATGNSQLCCFVI